MTAVLTDLRDALLAAGQPPESFQLAGVHENVPLPTDFWFLRPTTAGRWEIGSYERGTYAVRETHDSVSAAGAALRRVLLGST